MAAATAQIKVYPDSELTAQDFAILIERLSTEAAGIIYGCGISKKPDNNNTLVVASGWCLVRGRLIYISTGDLTVTLPSSGSSKMKVYVEVNLGDSSNPAKITVSSTAPSDNELFNQNSSTSYLELASFTMSSSGLSNISNTQLMSRPPKRNNTLSKMITKVLSLGKTGVTTKEALTVSEVNSLLGLNLTAEEAQSQVFVQAYNAHWEANHGKINAVSYQLTTKKWFVHFTAATAENIRVNLSIVYTPPTV